MLSVRLVEYRSCYIAGGADRGDGGRAMAFVIDSVTWDKHAKYPQLDSNGDGRGYGSREGVIPSSIVIHTTNGNKGSSFSAEANFLRDSPDVSAHFLVGKAGEIAQILHPAWEA